MQSHKPALQMKIFTLSFLLFAASAIRSFGLTLPVFEDTYSTESVLKKKAGIAGNLAVAPKHTALMRFDLTPSGLTANQLAHARLTFYVQKVTKPGMLTLHAVTSDWTEGAKDAAQPTIDSAVLASVIVAETSSKQFVTVDVTAQVHEWLSSPELDFGFAIRGDASASVTLGAKEGPGSGYPAVVDIQEAATIGNDYIAAGVDAVKLGAGTVDNAEFSALDGVVGPLQIQLNGFSTSLAQVNDFAGTKVSKAGDTMTGTLVLPENGLRIGTNQLAFNNGQIGIGTPAPTAALDVRGDVKLGSTGQDFATGGSENLRIIRGVIRIVGGQYTVEAGTGFTLDPVAGIVFNTPFASIPAVVVGFELVSSATFVGAKAVTANGFKLVGGLGDGTALHFIVAGPR